jgi:hypothetical protein
MGIFKAEFIENSSGITPRKAKSLTSHKWQTGKKTNYQIDVKRKALPSGKRISKNGKIYYESRRDRSDIGGLGI